MEHEHGDRPAAWNSHFSPASSGIGDNYDDESNESGSTFRIARRKVSAMTEHNLFYYPYASFTNAQLPLLKVAALYFDKLVTLDSVGASWARSLIVCGDSRCGMATRLARW